MSSYIQIMACKFKAAVFAKRPVCSLCFQRSFLAFIFQDRNSEPFSSNPNHVCLQSSSSAYDDPEHTRRIKRLHFQTNIDTET